MDFICRMRELPFVEVVQRLNQSLCVQSYCWLQECRRYPYGQVINVKWNEEDDDIGNPQEQKKCSWKCDVIFKASFT